jgi:hypothetical protein
MYSWIVNKVVLTPVAMGNIELAVYRPTWFAYGNQGVTITHPLLLAGSIPVGNVGRGDYIHGMPAGIRSINFCLFIK